MSNSYDERPAPSREEINDIGALFIAALLGASDEQLRNGAKLMHDIRAEAQASDSSEEGSR